MATTRAAINNQAARLTAPLSWVVAGVLVTLAWEAIAYLALSASTRVVVPTPAASIAVIELEPQKMLGLAMTTAKHAALGLLLASLVSTALALAVAFKRDAEHIVLPLATLVKVTPVIAVVPVLLVLTPRHYAASIVLAAAMVSFFPIAIGAIDGLKSIPPRLSDFAFHYGSSAWSQIVHIGARYLVRGLVLGLKTGAPLSVLGAMVGDYAVGMDNSIGGLGRFIFVRVDGRDPAGVFAGLILGASLGLLFITLPVLVSAYVDSRSHFTK